MVVPMKVLRRMVSLSLSSRRHHQATSKAKVLEAAPASRLVAIVIQSMGKALAGLLAMVWLTIDAISTKIDRMRCMAGRTTLTEWVPIDHTSQTGPV